MSFLVPSFGLPPFLGVYITIIMIINLIYIHIYIYIYAIIYIITITIIYLERPNPGKFQVGAQYLGYSLVLRENLGFFRKTSGFPSKPYFSHIKV